MSAVDDAGRPRGSSTGGRQAANDAAYDVFKGILILVIVAGHNEAITYRWPGLRQVFYYFNVQCFFMLSFVLDRKPFSMGFLRDRSVRYLVPYVAFMLLAAAAYLPLRGLPEGLVPWGHTFAQAIYNGNESTIHEAVGMRVFWFLPALFSLVVLRSLTALHPRLIVALCIAGVIWMSMVARVSPEVSYWIPLGLGSAGFFFCPCVWVRGLFDSVWIRGQAAIIGIAAAVSLACIAAIIATPLGWVAGANPAGYDLREPATFVVGIVFPTAMFFTLLGVAKFLHPSRMLQLCGRYSLGIFLVHMFIYRALSLAIFGRRFTSLDIVGPHLVIGLMLFGATLGISLAISASLPRFPRLNNLIFPRDWASWRGAIAGFVA